MSPSLRLLPALALLLAACQKETVEAPWLTYPGLDGHARYLPLLNTSHDPNTQASVTCASCHPGTTFTQPVCTGCHGQAATAGLHTSLATGQTIAGYEWTPPPPAPWQRPSCLTCHPQGGIPDASHHSFFPVDEASSHSRAKLGSAAGSFCLACHSDPLDKANVQKLNCVLCHQGAGVQVPLPGSHATLLTVDSFPIVPTPRDCLRCHDGGQVDRVAAHGSLPGPPGFGSAGPWDSDPICGTDPLRPTEGCKHGRQGSPVNCFACHDALPPAYGGTGPGLPSRPWAQDWNLPATSLGQTAGPTNARGTARVHACAGCHQPQ
ncbi:MAG: hypothetical protein HZB56_13090 [Deltaproteobacteria bacterium]|nr:hypothetical protein [Deltaproteobacteria bacterium]